MPGKEKPKRPSQKQRKSAAITKYFETSEGKQFLLDAKEQAEINAVQGKLEAMDSQQLMAEHNYAATSSTVAKRRSPTTPAAFPTHTRQSSKEMESGQDGSESDGLDDRSKEAWKKHYMADRGYDPSSIAKKRHRIESSDLSRGADQPGSSKSGGKKQNKKKKQKHPSKATVVNVKVVGETQLSQSSGIGKLKQPHSSPGQWPNGYGSNSSQSTGVSSPAYDSHSEPEWRSPKKKGKRKFVKKLSGLSSSSSGQNSPEKKQQKKHRGSRQQQSVQQPVAHPHSEFSSADETGNNKSDQPGRSHKVDNTPIEGAEGDQLVPPESADGDGVVPEADQPGELRFKPWRVDFGPKNEKGKLFKAYRLQVMDDFNRGPISNDRATRAAKLAEIDPSRFLLTRGIWAKQFVTLEKCKKVYKALCDRISFTTIKSDIMQPSSSTQNDESSVLIRQMKKYIQLYVPGREEELSPVHIRRCPTPYKEEGPQLSEGQIAHLDEIQKMKLDDKLSIEVNEFLRLQVVKDQLPANRTEVGEMLGLTGVVINSSHKELLEEVERIRQKDDEKKTVERSRRLGDGLDLTDTNCKVFLRRIHMEIERIKFTAEKTFLALWPNATVGNSKAPKWFNMGNVGPVCSLPTYNWDGTPAEVKEEMLKALELEFPYANDGSPKALTIRRNIYNTIKPAVVPTAFKILKRFIECLQKADECDLCNFEVNMKAWLKTYDSNTVTKACRNRDLLPYRRIRCSTLQAYHKLLTLLAKAVGLLPLKYETDPFNEELAEMYRRGVPQEVFNPRCHFTIAEVDFCCRELIKQRIATGVGVSPADIQMMLLWQMFVLLGKRPQSFVPHKAGMGDYNGLLVGDLGFRLIKETIVVEMRIRHEKQMKCGLEPINRRSRYNEYDMVNLLILHLRNLNAIDETTMDLSKGHIQFKESAKCQNLFVQMDYHSGLLLTEKPMTINCLDSIMEKLADVAHLPVAMVSPKCFRISFYQELEVGLMRTKGMSRVQARQTIAEWNGVRPNSMSHYDGKAMLKEADVTYYMIGASGQLSPLGEDDRIVTSDVTLMRADEEVYYWHGNDAAVIKYAESMVQSAGWNIEDELPRFLRLCKAIADQLNQQTLFERRDNISRTGPIPTSLNPTYAGNNRVLRVVEMSGEMNILARDVRLQRCATCPYSDCNAELTYGWAGHLKVFHQIKATDTNITCPLCDAKLAHLDSYTKHIKIHVGIRQQTQMLCSGCRQRVNTQSKKYHKCPSGDKDISFYPYQWCPWFMDEVVGHEAEIPILSNEVIQSYTSVEDDNEDR